MRFLLCVLAVACVLVCATTAYSGPVTDSISFQGRLTDAGDVPVPDGPRDLILSFWSDSVGGTMLHSELRTVDVATGLYTTCIGCDDPAFFDIFTDQSLYLQVQLAGEPAMAPRTPLRYAPRSLISARVRGDVYTENGRLRVRDNIGSSGEDGVDLTADAASSGLRVSNIGSSGQDGVDVRVDGSGSKLTVSNIGSSGLDGVELRADGTSSRLSVSNLGSSGQDGVEILADNTERRLRVSNLGSSGQDGVDVRVVGSSSKLTVSNIGSSGLDGVELRADGSSSNLRVSNLGSSGLDGVSITDDVDASSMQMARKRPGRTTYSNVTLRALADSVTDYRDCDSDDDGIFDTRLAVVLGNGGGGGGGGGLGGGAGGSMVMDVDSDGDGFGDQSVESSVSPTTAKHAINTKGTGGNRSITSTTDDLSVIDALDADDDNDGVSDRSVIQSVTPTTSSVAIKTKGTGADANKTARQRADVTLGDITVSSVIDDDGDGIPETEYQQRLTPTTSGFAIKTKGTGADPNRSSGVTAEVDDTTASVAGGIDLDGDGEPENEFEQRLTPTTSSVAIKSKGTGADPNRVIGSTDDSTAVMLLATDSASITMTVRKGGGTVKGNVIVNSGSGVRMVGFGSDGNGYFATGLGVGVDPTQPIEVAGGAYCDGTAWVNVSDENSKENFTAIDGEALLEKIDALPVRQWNYKNDSDDRLHIGPTAQDFQQTFGVGSDGKSISTIDPSGIALAAIKQLSKQNRELKDQNSGLQKQLDEIKRQVELILQTK